MKDLLASLFANMSKMTSFKETLEWNDQLGDTLIYVWKRDIEAIRCVPKSLRASYMAGYLPSEELHLIYDLTNWLIENGVPNGNSV